MSAHIDYADREEVAMASLVSSLWNVDGNGFLANLGTFVDSTTGQVRGTISDVDNGILNLENTIWEEDARRVLPAEVTLR